MLPAGHHLLSHNLVVLERLQNGDPDFRYLFFNKSGVPEPCGLAYFQIVLFGSKNYRSPLFKNIVAKTFEQWIMKKGFRIVVCGNLYRIDAPGVYFSKPEDMGDVMDSIESFFKTLKPFPHAILIKDWQHDWSTGWVKYKGYHSWPNDLTMKLEISPSWRSFNDYLSALKHKYAQRVRKARRRFSNVTRRELSEAEILQHGPQLEKLYLQVVEKQLIKLVISNRNYFIEMKKAYGNSFVLYGYFLLNELIAFSSNILYDESWELHYIGMDYSRNEDLWLYYNIMYDAVEDAILARREELELGRTAREAKAILGGEPVYFNSFVRLKNPAVNFLVENFATRFNSSEGASPEDRHPFKSVNNQ